MMRPGIASPVDTACEPLKCRVVCSILLPCVRLLPGRVAVSGSVAIARQSLQRLRIPLIVIDPAMLSRNGQLDRA